jgi:hypothetical protein
MAPSRRRCPLLCSLDTKPTKAINFRADGKRWKVCNSTTIDVAATVSRPRKQRSMPTGTA